MAYVAIWGVAALAYAAFLAWHVNWRGAMKPQEAAALAARVEKSGAAEPGSDALESMKRFLAEDDGREFFMLNLVRVAPGAVADPKTGAMKPAREVMQDYTKPFMRALFARGGHPAFIARKVGGYMDAWAVEPDPGWTIAGFMRYRSRRDVAELVADARFVGMHDFKIAATPQTLSFPSQTMISTMAGPRVWLALVLALGAALSHIVLSSLA